MSISVDIGLLSGKTNTLEVNLDEPVETLQRRAQMALGVGSGRLLNSSGSILNVCVPIRTAMVQHGGSLTLHVISGVQVQVTENALPRFLVTDPS